MVLKYDKIHTLIVYLILTHFNTENPNNLVYQKTALYHFLKQNVE